MRNQRSIRLDQKLNESDNTARSLNIIFMSRLICNWLMRARQFLLNYSQAQ